MLLPLLLVITVLSVIGVVSLVVGVVNDPRPPHLAPPSSRVADD